MKYLGLCLLLTLVPSALMAQTLPGGFRAAYVEGTVVAGDTGKPLIGAKVDIVGAKVSKKGIKAENGCGAGFALTANNGNFAVGVGQNNMCVNKKHPLNGKYFVTVSKRQYLPQIMQIDFGTHNTNVIGGLIFRLLPAHASIQGQVFSGGKGLAFAHAWAMKDPYGMALHPPKGHVLATISEIPMVRTDANGKFTIPVSPGNYIVMASKSGYQLMTKTSDPAMDQMYQRLASNPFMTPQQRASLAQMNQPQLGDHVSVAVDQIASADLAMVKASPPPNAPGMMRKPTFAPYKVYLAGQARSSTNNVLFFTSQTLGGSLKGPVELYVVRSRTLLGAGNIAAFKSHLKSFNFLLYGYPGGVGCQHRAGHISNYYCADAVLSFTDPTAQQGVAYYYSIFESAPLYIGPGGTTNFNEIGSQYSNAVQLVTH
jgi:hypothetical protein